MPISLHVETYSGYRSHQRPTRFTLGTQPHEIASIEDQWREPEGECYKVRTENGRSFILCYSRETDQWTLQHGLTGADS